MTRLLTNCPTQPAMAAAAAVIESALIATK